MNTVNDDSDMENDLSNVMDYIISTQVQELSRLSLSSPTIRDSGNDNAEFKETDDDASINYNEGYENTNEQHFKRLIQVIESHHKKMIQGMTRGKEDILKSINEIANQNLLIIGILDETTKILKSVEETLHHRSNAKKFNENISIDTYSNTKSAAILVTNADNVDTFTNISEDDVSIKFATNSHIVHPSTSQKRRKDPKREKYRLLINQIRNQQIEHFHFDSAIIPRKQNYVPKLMQNSEFDLYCLNAFHIIYILKSFIKNEEYCLSDKYYIHRNDNIGKRMYRQRLVEYLTELTDSNIGIKYNKLRRCYVIYEIRISFGPKK